MEVIYNLENHASCLPSAKAAGVQSTYSVCCATEKLAALGTAWPLSLKGLFSGALVRSIWSFGLFIIKHVFCVNWSPGTQALLGGWNQLQSPPTPVFISFRCQMPASPGEGPANLLFVFVTSYVASRISINKGH